MGSQASGESLRARSRFALGFLEGSAVHLGIAVGARFLRPALVSMHPYLEQKYVTIAVLLGLLTAMLVGLLHHRRGEIYRSAGAYAAATFWPVAAVAWVLGHFALQVIEWGRYGE